MSNIVKSETQALNLFNPEEFKGLLNVAEYFSKSDLVPKQYQAVAGAEQKAIANCVIAFDMAQRMQANPLMVMQNMHVIQGRPSWSAQFIIAAINSAGRWEELEFDYQEAGELRDIPYPEKVWNAQANNGRGAYENRKGKLAGPMKNVTCVCKSRKIGSTKELVGPEVTMEMAIREGWYTKTDSKWQTMPKIMLMYRAATFWKSVYAPDVLMGMPSTEELRDVQETTYEEVPLADKVKAAAKASRETVVITPEPEEEKAPEGVDPETGEVTTEQKQPEAPATGKGGKKPAKPTEAVKEPEPSQEESAGSVAPDDSEEEDFPQLSH